MKTAESSQTALLVLAGILMLLGNMIPSPGGRLLLLIIAGLVAAAVLLLGSFPVRRVIAFLILAIVVFQSLAAWRQYRSESDRYRHGAHPGDTNRIPG
jgi:membrane protein implicated in regulation of membrane protease activity